MKKCTNCIHVDVCDMHCEQQNVQGCCDCMITICRYIDAEKCPNFQDASKFIELPCPVGTTLYKVYSYMHTCSLYKTCKNEIYCRDLHNCPNLTNNKCDSHIEYHILELPNAHALNILMVQKDFGTRVFLTREDAERKVRELNGEM